MFRPYDSDHAGSEDMDDILEMSLLEHQNTTKEAKSGPSGAQPSYLRKHDLNSRVSALDIEIQDIDEQIQKLRAVQQALLLEKEGLLRQCQLLSQPGSSAAATCRAKGKCKAVNNTIDYSIEFDWAPELKSMMKVFGINNFRLCQQGVCNANLDGRDVVCVMPTGLGPS
ncbi:hypothetical protein ID866_6038 [Astraeus odoratus]|nr:hypothetical protein ID866_6038 [Astraeus odoratus]